MCVCVCVYVYRTARHTSRPRFRRSWIPKWRAAQGPRVAPPKEASRVKVLAMPSRHMTARPVASLLLRSLKLESAMLKMLERSSRSVGKTSSV